LTEAFEKAKRYIYADPDKKAKFYCEDGRLHIISEPDDGENAKQQGGTPIPPMPWEKPPKSNGGNNNDKNKNNNTDQNSQSDDDTENNGGDDREGMDVDNGHVSNGKNKNNENDGTDSKGQDPN